MVRTTPALAAASQASAASSSTGPSVGVDLEAALKLRDEKHANPETEKEAVNV